jgi:hypothetical protein
VDVVNIKECEMMIPSNIAKEVRKAWSASAPLTATALLMFAALIASIAGILLDHRVITGVPAWLKPAKFAISTSIFAGTMAWLYQYISVWPRFVRAMGWVMSLVLILEVAIIDLQAARGTTSHFNVATPLDAVLFGIMGTAIAVLWLGSIGVLIAIGRQKFSNTAWGWWLRLGMLVTVFGAASGGLMLRPTSAQSEQLQTGDSIGRVGAHTVGAPDGGPGLAGVGWSTQHGDLRIPHFFGLHGIQLLPLVGWLMLRRRNGQSDRNQTRLAFAAAASYLGFVGILTWQALRGQSLVAPDSATLVALAIWLVTTVSAGLLLLRNRAFGNDFTAARTTI